MNNTDLYGINMYGMYTTWHVQYPFKGHRRQGEVDKAGVCGLTWMTSKL